MLKTATLSREGGIFIFMVCEPKNSSQTIKSPPNVFCEELESGIEPSSECPETNLFQPIPLPLPTERNAKNHDPIPGRGKI